MRLIGSIRFRDASRCLNLRFKPSVLRASPQPQPHPAVIFHWRLHSIPFARESQQTSIIPPPSPTALWVTSMTSNCSMCPNMIAFQAVRVGFLFFFFLFYDGRSFKQRVFVLCRPPPTYKEIRYHIESRLVFLITYLTQKKNILSLVKEEPNSLCCPSKSLTTLYNQLLCTKLCRCIIKWSLNLFSIGPW